MQYLLFFHLKFYFVRYKVLPFLFLLKFDKGAFQFGANSCLLFSVRLVSYKHYRVGFHLSVQMETIYAWISRLAFYACIFLFMFTFIPWIITQTPDFLILQVFQILQERYLNSSIYLIRQRQYLCILTWSKKVLKCFPLPSFLSCSLIFPLFCLTVWFNKLVVTFLVIVIVGNYPGQMSSKEQEEGKE